MRRAPDYFVPRSLLSLETLRSAWNWGRAAVGPGKPPQPLGLGGGRTPGVARRASPGSGVSPAALCLPRPHRAPRLPHSCGLMMESPRWRFPAPWGGASFRGRLRVPSTSPPAAARRPSPHGAACALTARGSPRHVSVQAEAGRTCLGAFGSPRGARTPRGAQGAGGEQGLRWGLGGSGVICSSCVRVCVCVLPFVRRHPRWMRCDRGVQARAVQIKSS